MSYQNVALNTMCDLKYCTTYEFGGRTNKEVVGGHARHHFPIYTPPPQEADVGR